MELSNQAAAGEEAGFCNLAGFLSPPGSLSSPGKTQVALPPSSSLTYGRWEVPKAGQGHPGSQSW